MLCQVSIIQDIGLTHPWVEKEVMAKEGAVQAIQDSREVIHTLGTELLLALE